MSRCLPGLVMLLALPAVVHAQYPPPCVVPVAVPVRVVHFVPAPPPPVLVAPPPVCPVPVAPAPVVPETPAAPLAAPGAAPPSSGPIPYPGAQAPPSRPMPPADSPTSATVQVSKTSDPAAYDVYPVAARGGVPAGDRPLVSFWNLSDRDLTLKVAGQMYVVPRGGRERLRLDRHFAWQVEGREERNEEVADGGAGLEIVLRR
jgi:hypothetical protein